MPRTLTITAVALLAAMGLPVPASADHVACGDTITQDTKLDSDLICAGDGLTVTGSGVTLDLAGHTISGLGTGAGVDVRRAGTSGESIRRESRSVGGPSGGSGPGSTSTPAVRP